MRGNNGFYVIEGDNGVGKTSTITGVAARLGYPIVKTPGPAYEGMRPHVHRAGSNNFAKFLFYMSANFDAESTIKELLKTVSVLCDRYIASSFVDFMILAGLDFDEVKSTYGFFKEEMLMPDITFLLKCNHEERVKRVLGRNAAVAQRDDGN